LPARAKGGNDTWQLTKRLDAIINILLETSRLDGKAIPVAKRIEILHTSGLRPVEISRILGKSLTNISVQLNLMKKAQSKKNKA
jgi:hypothetical protein